MIKDLPEGQTQYEDGQSASTAGLARRIVFHWNQAVKETGDGTYPIIIAKFAERIAFDEREACARACEAQAEVPECPERAQYCADAIRMRSNVEFRGAGRLYGRRPLERKVRTLEENMQLVLIRGLPGSGKSTIAHALHKAGFEWFEADTYHLSDEGDYCYDPANVKAAHEWCQRETFKALANGKRVVVSNTFTRRFELEPYFEMAKTFGIEPNILTATGNWPNVHGVPAEVVEKMRQRWEKSYNVKVSGAGTASAGLPG